MQRPLGATALVATVFLLSLVLVPFAKADWPMFHHDLSHSGAVGHLPIVPTQTWKYTTGGAGFVVSSPAVVDGVVYVGSRDGNVYALNAFSGLKIWSYTTVGQVFCSPAVVDGVVYVGSGWIVYALAAINGVQLWNYTNYSTDGTPFGTTYGIFVWSSPAVVDGIVCIGSEDANVYAFNATTGAKIWNYKTGRAVTSSPAVVDGVVYIGSEDNNVYALNATTGLKLWNYFMTGGGVISSPAVADGVVYIGGRDVIGGFSPTYTFYLYALNATNGLELWKYPGGVGYSSPAVVDGVVYVSLSGNVYALDAATGNKIWNQTLWMIPDEYPEQYSSPAVVDGVVYIGSEDSNVYALDATSGRQLWNFTTLGRVRSSPAVVDGVVYVGSLDCNVYAIVSNPTPFPAIPEWVLLLLVALFVVAVFVIVIAVRRKRFAQS